MAGCTDVEATIVNMSVRVHVATQAAEAQIWGHGPWRHQWPEFMVEGAGGGTAQKTDDPLLMPGFFPGRPVVSWN
jgi:hypothetical protein